MESESGMNFTNGQQLLTFNGQGEQDWNQGYQSGGNNYSCPSCGKAFAALHSMLSHCQSRPQCRGGGHQALTFH
jgi:hypothetical protein